MTPEKLFHNHKKLAYHLAKKIKAPHFELEDREQTALMALWKAALKFDPLKGFRFSSYAYRAIKNTLIRACDTHCRTLRVIDFDNQKLLSDDYLETMDPDWESPFLAVYRRDCLRDLDIDHKIVLAAIVQQNRLLSRSSGISDKRFDKISRSLRDNQAIRELLKA